MEFLEGWDEDGGDEGDDDDVITLRGPSARALLGILEGHGDDGGQGKGDGGKGDGNGGDGGDGGEPGTEPAPQRGQSRYFGEK